MKSRSLLAAVASFLVLGLSVQAQSGGSSADKKQKSPADLAGEQFMKLRAGADAKPEQATFQKMIEAGLAWLIEFPTDNRAPEIVNDLGSFGYMLTGKDDKVLRGSYAAQLQYEVVNQKYKPGLTPDAKTALAAVDAAASDALARDNPTTDNLRALRDKIDNLARQPNNSAFLVDAERHFFEILTLARGAASGERQLRSLLDHPDKKVAEMAQKQLNLAEVRKQPLAFKFTAVDGKVVDCAQLRGKVIAVLFWTAANSNSVKEVAALKSLYDDYHRDGLEVIVISYDTPENKEKLAAAVKETKLPWPVYHDGLGKENELGKKLNIERVPRVALFDQKGILAQTDLQPSRIGNLVKRMLGIPDAPRDMSAPKRKGRR
jgi:peroxiredoxin